MADLLDTTIKRLEIAQDIVRRADTVTLLRAEEVREIYRKALAGEYDDYEQDRNSKAADALLATSDHAPKEDA